MKRTPLNISAFIEKSGANEVVARLEKKLQNPGGEMPALSDMVKIETGTDGKVRTYQYVNYVQEGGGVLGIALLGYTYVLEKLGVRFYKLAGTSAGAINTLLTAATDPLKYEGIIEKKDTTPILKSEAVLYELLRQDLFELVDGHPFARKIIQRFLKSKNYMERILNNLMLFLKIFLGGVFVFTVLHVSGLAHLSRPILWGSALVLGGVILLGFLLLIVLYFNSSRYLGLFVKSKYGICTGNFFSSWMKDILKFNDIVTTADLENRLKQNQSGVRLRTERQAENKVEDHKPVAGSNIILITSDITNQRKVEFPAMAKYYWENPEEASPADFVRASMAIPIFFEPFIRQVTRPPQTEEEKLILQNIPPHTGPGNPFEVRFVDGGILSNFPINVFHNPNIPIARLPTFGVKLEDEEHEDPAKPASLKKTLFSYIGNIFSTIRFYYDRDFLLKNQLYQRTIGHVDVSGFNWLNFFLSEEEKVAMFKKGAEAAETFFTGGTVWADGKPRAFEAYNWETYKQLRAEVVKVERKEAENSLL